VNVEKNALPLSAASGFSVPLFPFPHNSDVCSDLVELRKTMFRGQLRGASHCAPDSKVLLLGRVPSILLAGLHSLNPLCSMHHVQPESARTYCRTVRKQQTKTSGAQSLFEPHFQPNGITTVQVILRQHFASSEAQIIVQAQRRLVDNLSL
jgi:hypothetical protein